MDYFSRARGNSRNNVEGPSSSRPGTSSNSGPTTPGSVGPLTPADTPSRNPSAMRLRRLPSTGTLRLPGQELRRAHSQTFAPSGAGRGGRGGGRSPSRFDSAGTSTIQEEEPAGRRRSFSDPSRPQAAQIQGVATRQQDVTLPTVLEERPSNPLTPAAEPVPPAQGLARTATNRLRAVSSAAADALRSRPDRENQRDRRGSAGSGTGMRAQNEEGRPYEAEVTDFLDVIDPEVSTLTTLNNVQNSLFIPYLGRLYNRQPMYTLSRPQTAPELPEIPPGAKTRTQLEETETEDEGYQVSDTTDPHTGLHRLHTIKSTLSGTSIGHNYAVLPHGVRLEGWTEEELDELNNHVRHLLHSRRESFKRSMRAFGKYVRKPMGFFVTLYAFIITFWGAAWVLFLIGWIHAGGRRDYFVEICDQILTALLVVIGIGLFPWRCVDTYHMIYIAHYHYKVWQLRAQHGLQRMKDPNDLPDTDPRISTMLDSEQAADVRAQVAEKVKEEEVVMLPLEQQRKLKHHQDKFAKSHTFFKPHETITHRAFPIKLLITVVVLLDFHSFFQMALGGTTWGINYHVRPRALTTVILALSISCNIAGGITISVGDHKSRKKEVFERMFRQKRTSEAMKKIEKKKGKGRYSTSREVGGLEKRGSESSGEEEARMRMADEEGRRLTEQAMRQVGVGTV